MYAVTKNDIALVREIFLYFYILFTLCDMCTTCLYGGLNFNTLPKVSGKFGVGIKHLYTDKFKQSVLALYPIEKVKYERVMLDEDKQFKINLYGDDKMAAQIAKIMK